MRFALLQKFIWRRNEAVGSLRSNRAEGKPCGGRLMSAALKMTCHDLIGAVEQSLTGTAVAMLNSPSFLPAVKVESCREAEM